MRTWARAVSVSLALGGLLGACGSESATPPPAEHLGRAREALVVTAGPAYWGGPVLSAVKVYAVFWGSNVDSTVTSGIGGFYQTATDFPYMAWLDAEYNTFTSSQDGRAGTNQNIQPGSFAGGFTITPSNGSTNLSQGDVEAELQHQLDIGALPAPDANALYMMHFPLGTSVTTPDGHKTCAGGSQTLCAYHSFVVRNGQRVAYAVLPDHSDPGCAAYCSSVGSQSPFDWLTSTASHELFEAITDPYPWVVQSASGWVPVYPSGWRYQGGDEIADVCFNSDWLPTSRYTGKTYLAQKSYSRVQGACILTPFYTVDPALNIKQGQSGTMRVRNSGTKNEIVNCMSALPPGMSFTLDKSVLVPGDVATFTFTATAATPTGGYGLRFIGSIPGAVYNNYGSVWVDCAVGTTFCGLSNSCIPVGAQCTCPAGTGYCAPIRACVSDPSDPAQCPSCARGQVSCWCTGTCMSSAMCNRACQ